MSQTPAARTVESFLAGRPSESTRALYRPALRDFMLAALGLDASGKWDCEDRFRALMAQGGQRVALDAMARHVTWMLGQTRTRKNGEVVRRFNYEAMDWRFKRSREWSEYVLGEGLPAYNLKELRRMFASYKTPAKVRPGIRPEVLGQILDWLGPESRAFAMVMKSTGGRPFEVAGLTANDVNLGVTPPRVHFTNVKEGGDRWSFLDAETRPRVDMLVRAAADNPGARLFSGNTARETVKRVRRDWAHALKRLRLDERDADGRLTYRLYKLRAYFRSAGRRGMDREVLEILLGHHGNEVEDAYREYKDDLDWLGQKYLEGQDALYCETARGTGGGAA